jgi:hypothetical protein
MRPLLLLLLLLPLLIVFRDTLPASALWTNETATVGATNACI